MCSPNVHYFLLNRFYSPELVHDSTRDFSVYILDPLESLASSTPNPSSSSLSQQQHPRGVAVGLGLMSWALLADEESAAVHVTGTVMTLANGEGALEVIFALKEVRFVPPVVSYLFIMPIIMPFFLLLGSSVHNPIIPHRIPSFIPFFPLRPYLFTDQTFPSTRHHTCKKRPYHQLSNHGVSPHLPLLLLP